MSHNPEFDAERAASLATVKADKPLQDLSLQWISDSAKHKYTYGYSWMGRPIIQFPQDMVAMQEIIWETQPDLIIETGVAHGGSLVFYASILSLIGGNRRVIGIDIDIRDHNRKALDSHPMRSKIDLVEGSSTDPATVAKVRELATGRSKIAVCLDSNHTHAHVLEEMRLYSPLVTKGSYLVVFDTIVEQMPEGAYPDRPWGRGNNPMTAVQAFLEETDRFVIDRDVDAKNLISVAPGGYLRCIRD